MQYMCFAAEQWDLTMGESEHFSLEKCTTDEKTTVWDNMAANYDLGMGTDPRRVNMAVERLDKLGAFNPETVALDIASGTGAYTLALAQKCKTVYALDNSEGMQAVLLEKAEKLGLNNIIPIKADWRKVHEGELPCKFDIVLSSLNTGINDYDSLVKMNSVSRGFCCYAAPHGNAIHTSRPDFQKIVFGRELRTAGGNDIIHAFNIIYGLGYQPELTYAPCEWTRAQTAEESLAAVCREFGRYKRIDDDLKARFSEYIMLHLNEETLFIQSQKSTIGIMIWDTKKLAE